MEKELRLPLIRKWFEMTEAGFKKEDYREVNEYWGRRLLEVDENFSVRAKQFDINTMRLGYPKSTDTERIIKFEHKGIEIRTGNPEWGAEPNKLYFVIMHGDIIK